MRLVRFLIAFACLAAGLALGGLNTQPVLLDLGVVQWSTSLGVVVIVALLAGALLGGLALATSRLRPARPRGGAAQ